MYFSLSQVLFKIHHQTQRIVAEFYTVELSQASGKGCAAAAVHITVITSEKMET